MNNIKNINLIVFLVVTSISYFLVMDVLLCLTPPIARDALIHHLAIPKLWINYGGFYDTPWAAYSYYPMNLELLYLISLYFGNDIIPNLIHLGFGIGTALIIFFYLKSRFNQIAGLLGTLIFISTPVISKLSTMAYVDLGMVFFITASVLSFIRWRDSKYDQSRWLLISAIAMGLALGTKYSSLVPWFFVTLAIVFIYSRDTGNSGKALKYGLIYFIVSLAVFSPWLVKNFILTGNPFYPLFPGIFNRVDDGNANALALVHGHASLFKTRGMLFGESLWEILLIPIRVFFQGQDHSPRYFDGVLNPILIVFVPFAFMKKDMKVEKLFFLYFSIFILLVALFLDQIRIRYILPVIPFLVILSVVGIINIYVWLKEFKSGILLRIGLSGLVIIVLVLLSLNVIYIHKYFLKIDPLSYLTKRETRDDFIARHDGSYPAIMYVNRNTPKDSRIRLILLAGRGYYLNRIYQEDRSMDMGLAVIQGMIDHSSSKELFQQYLSSLDCTHLLIRYELFDPYIQEKFDSEKVNQLKKQMSDTLMKIYDDKHYRIFCTAKQKCELDEGFR